MNSWEKLIEILCGSVIANAEQAGEVVGERSLTAIRLMTGDSTAYFNMILWDLLRAFLWAIL